MKGVAKAFELSQGNRYILMAALLPTLHTLIGQLRTLLVSMFCDLLVDTLKIAVITSSVSRCFSARFTSFPICAGYNSTTFVVCSTAPHLAQKKPAYLIKICFML